MTPLKEMYQRIAELQKKLTDNPKEFFTEDQNELAELNTLVSLREKYLQRYINHPPRALESMQTILAEEFTGMIYNDETRAMIADKIRSTVHDWLTNNRQVACKSDADDLEVYLSANVKAV
ncbi:hypothetical protein DEEACLCL_00106 [Salmonella phage CRW-SP2]|nr:hypothetical protein DEEACLCL_00106 [Salmonella phage CRW-SP2]